VLALTEGTVKNYVSAILAKTGLHDRTQAALFAVRRVAPSALLVFLGPVDGDSRWAHTAALRAATGHTDVARGALLAP